MAIDLKDYIASIPDYPTKGILFRDVTPLVDDGEAFRKQSGSLQSMRRVLALI